MKPSVNQFLRGLRSYWDAQRLAFRHRLWPLLVAPGLAGLLYPPAILYLGMTNFTQIETYVREHWLPTFLQQKYFAFLVTLALAFLAAYAGYVLFRNILMILYSPVIGYLSERTEAAAFPAATKAAFRMDWQSVWRSIQMSLISLSISIAVFAGCCLLLPVPILGQLGMLCLMPMCQMFLAGQGFLDPVLERRQFSVKGSFDYCWRHKWGVIGCGCGFVCLTAIPLFGWFVGPTLGIVAGTLVALNLLASPDDTRTSK